MSEFADNLRKRAWHSDRIMKWALSTPPHLFLFVFLVFPGVIVVIASICYPGEFGGLSWGMNHAGGSAVNQGRFTLETYRFFFADTIFLEVLLRSFAIAVVTTLLCIVLSFPLAMLIARRPVSQRYKMILFVILPFASNFLIRIYAWIIILGPFNLLYSSFAVIVGMVYVHLPFMILPLYANLEQHDPLLLDAARDLGATPWQRFFRVTLPLSLPGIFSGSALVFIPVLGTFAIPELLGGTGDIMIGNLIKEQFLESRDWPFGATLSLVLSLFILAVVKMTAFLSKPRRRK